MKTLHELILRPEEAFDDAVFPAILYRKLNLPEDGQVIVRPLKRSIDARGRHVVVRMQVEVIPREEFSLIHEERRHYENVSNAKQVVIVGSGPAGLFAAMRLIELGIKPVILERGKDVRSRRRDLAGINKEHVVNPDSNYCFGEGGAGTYSDGKLYTRSKKRGDIRRILEIMVAHGAKEEILFDAHPHIGTNKLPALIAAIRETILQSGGEILFNTRVDDFILEGDSLRGVVTQQGDPVYGEAVILATGHSAKDIFHLLYRRGIQIEAKPFALGVRVEHQQSLIDHVQYHCSTDRGQYLPASSYSLVHQARVAKEDRGVFSFCMCPGGFIVPSATAPGEVVVNGMSPSRRDSRFANSGIVVAVDVRDFATCAEWGPLAGLHFQSAIEQRACQIAGGSQTAPAQRLVDFIEGRVSSSLPESSYQPGLMSVDMKDVLPAFIVSALKQGFRNFGTKMNGYLTNDAQIVGVESRTSSPVKVPRDKETLMHTQIKKLYPCGEGAGYAGGIVSAAMDGERCAEAIAVQLGVTATGIGSHGKAT